MSPRPFYRSILFWLGIPGLIFLIWFWFPGTGFTVTWVRAKDRIVIASGGGTIGAAYQKFTVSRSTGLSFLLPPTGFTLEPRVNQLDPHEGIVGAPRLTMRKLFPPAIQESHIRGGTWASNVTFAVWLLGLLYLPVWLGTFAWWQRRKSHLLKLHTAQ